MDEGKSRFALVVLSLIWTYPAQAQGLLGDQLGIVQGAKTGQSNDPFQFDIEDQANDTVIQGPPLQFTGYQWTTQLTANVTLDIPGRLIEQSFLLGGAINQQYPYNIADNTRDARREAHTGLIANANYLARHVRRTSGLALRLGYAFTRNGRLANGPGGATKGIQTNALPGATAFNGFLSVTNDTHTANAAAPLGSARLIEGEGRLLDGTAGPEPGLPPDTTSDKERFYRSQRRNKMDKKNPSRGKVVSQNKTAQEEAQDHEDLEEEKQKKPNQNQTRTKPEPNEKQKKANEKQKKANEKQTRDFGDWLIQPESDPE